jgi:hypothetical protein
MRSGLASTLIFTAHRSAPRSVNAVCERRQLVVALQHLGTRQDHVQGVAAFEQDDLTVVQLQPDSRGPNRLRPGRVNLGVSPRADLARHDVGARISVIEGPQDDLDLGPIVEVIPDQPPGCRCLRRSSLAGRESPVQLEPWRTSLGLLDRPLPLGVGRSGITEHERAPDPPTIITAPDVAVLVVGGCHERMVRPGRPGLSWPAGDGRDRRSGTGAGVLTA